MNHNEGDHMTVRVYTKPHCSQCDMTKKKLDSLGIPYEVEDLTEEGNLEAAKALGHTSAPVVVVGEESWSGFRPDRINEIAQRLEEDA